MPNVVFDGPNKIITVNLGIEELNIQVDVYSDWKEWVVSDSNAQYLPAISVIGGDPISATKNLGATFFLENGWKIKPSEANHTLTVVGNIFTRDGSPVFIPTTGQYNVVINMNTSNIIDGLVGIGSQVWSQPKSNIVAGSMGQLLVDAEQKTDDNQALILASIR